MTGTSNFSDSEVMVVWVMTVVSICILGVLAEVIKEWWNDRGDK